MAPTLPDRPSAEHLRKQAKRLSKDEGVRLAEAQRRLANQYGAPSWAELLRRVADARGGDAGPALSPLAAAARAGDAAAVARLLAEGHASDGAPGDDAPPLWYACASAAPDAARVATAKALLAAGATPQRGGARGAALHAAAARGPLALVELLIRHGALEWQPDRKGRTPVSAAKRGGAADKTAIVELLDRPVIRDASFRAAVRAIHRGDVAALARLLDAEPRLLRERILEPDCYRAAQRHQYFRDPKLFWFVANNPTLVARLPENLVAVAEAMIERGVDREDLDYALELAMTSSSAREAGLQLPLVRALLAAGAAANVAAIDVALGHCERAPIEALLAAGQPLTAPIAAALGRTGALPALLAGAPADEIQKAFGLAVINGEREAARLALDAGADVNALLPIHAHSTALHHAAHLDDPELAELLLARGARTDVRDRLWDGTPLGWAEYGGRERAAAVLKRGQTPP